MWGRATTISRGVLVLRSAGARRRRAAGEAATAASASAFPAAALCLAAAAYTLPPRSAELPVAVAGRECV